MAATAAPGTRVPTLFLGSGGFALPALELLSTHPACRLVGVVSAPDRAAGRGGALASVPVARRARELGIPLLQPASIRTSEAVAAIGALAPALGVLADFGRIVPPSVLAIPPLGILNLHPSLLPRHRGATPVPATLLAGDAVAGVTVIRMDEGLDTGPIVAADSWPLTGTETGPELEARAAVEGAALLGTILPDWIAGRLPPRPQGDEGVTLTRPLRRDDGRLDPGRSAALLERQVRAYQPWPGSFLETAEGRLVVWRASVALAGDGRIPAPGAIVVRDGLPALATVEGLLVLEEVQLAGRRRIGGAELLRGRPGIAGTPVR